jgi:hypothetical protein
MPPRGSARRREIFREEFKKALEVRKMNLTKLAEEVDMAYDSLKKYKRGVHLPTMESAAKLADALKWPALSEAAKLQQTCEAEDCERTFWVNNRAKRRFCTRACSTRTYRLNVLRPDGKKRVKSEYLRKTHQLALHEEAVRLFCISCVGSDYICPDAECPLRPVSPMPLREKRKNAKAEEVISPRLNDIARARRQHAVLRRVG